MPLDEKLEDEEVEEQKKEKKKLFGKKNKDDAGEKAIRNLSPQASVDSFESDDEGGAFSIVLITFFIVVIWLAILGFLIKLDVGGFGSSVLAPVLRDVPVLKWILPDTETDETVETAQQYETLDQAIARIHQLEKELEEAKTQGASTTTDDSEAQIKALKDEVVRLKTFEDNQIEFQKIKTEFYEEVVFADQAPDIKEYKAYYESIDPANAEYLYKQVVQQMQNDEMLERYVRAYSQMKPKQAAAIFEEMPDNLELTAKILWAMDPDDRAKILGVMDAELASKLTKIMDPDE